MISHELWQMLATGLHWVLRESEQTVPGRLRAPGVPGGTKYISREERDVCHWEGAWEESSKEVMSDSMCWGKRQAFYRPNRGITELYSV